MFLFSSKWQKLTQKSEKMLSSLLHLCNLRYRCHNVDVKSAFTSEYRASSTTVIEQCCTYGSFNSLEWPLYGVLSILILLTVAILRLHSCSATRSTRWYEIHPSLATWFAFKPPHSRARSFRDSSSRLLSFSDFPTFPVRFDPSLAFFIDHARISLAVPSISLRIHRYPARERNVYGMTLCER